MTSSEVVRDAALLICDLLIKECKKIIQTKKKIKKRRCWVKRPIANQSILKSSQLLPDGTITDDSETFYRTHFQMSETQFENLLEKVTPFIQKQDTLMRNSLPSRLKLQVALSYLVEGSSFRVLENTFHVVRCSVSAFLPEVYQAIYHVLREHIKIPTTESEWTDVSKDYNTVWNFPNCCGVLAAKHIKGPQNSYQTNNSRNVLLLAIVDAKYNFLFIDINKNEGIDDISLFTKSNINKILLKRDEFNLPMDYFFAADKMFPLRNNIMKPYCEDQSLDHGQNLFNSRLSQVQLAADNAFGLLTARFKLLSKPINLHLNRVEIVVKAACALHNWINQTFEGAAPYIDEDMINAEMWQAGKIAPVNWHLTYGGLSDATNVADNDYDNVASSIRDAYAEKLVSAQ
ncbi:uncharacterized protein LOC143921779 [Arctopsyche grandis]|uniref:uncharacterized protein LOC143921779 n=1 Tax=Arctopsyche grandis TaxID=121162 RepID=UPI00406D6924